MSRRRRAPSGLPVRTRQSCLWCADADDTTLLSADGDIVCGPCLLDERLPLTGHLPGTVLYLWIRLSHPDLPAEAVVRQALGLPPRLLAVLVALADTHRGRPGELLAQDRYDHVVDGWRKLTDGQADDAVRLADGWSLPIGALFDTLQRLD